MRTIFCPDSPRSQRWHASRVAAGACCLVALIVLPGGAPLAAQAPAAAISPTLGSRVRVTLSPSATGKRARVVGTLLAAGPDSVRVERSTGETVSVPRQDVARFEVSLGRYRPVSSSIYNGAVIGGLGLGVLTAATYKDESCRTECYGGYDWRISRGELGLFAGFVGAVGGAFWGGVVGVLRKTDRWQAVSADRTTERLTVAPLLGGVRGVQVGFTF